MAISSRLPALANAGVLRSCATSQPHTLNPNRSIKFKSRTLLAAASDGRQPSSSSQTEKEALSSNGQRLLLQAPFSSAPTSTSSEGSKPPEPNNAFLRMLAKFKLKLPSWLNKFLAGTASPKNAVMFRMLTAVGTFFIVAVVRGFLVSKSQVAPREVGERMLCNLPGIPRKYIVNVGFLICSTRCSTLPLSRC